MRRKRYGKPCSQDFQINARLQTIILTEGNMIMKNEKLIADTFNYFVDITKISKYEKYPNFHG